MRAISTLLILSVSLTVLAGCSKPTAGMSVPDGWASFESPEMGVSLVHPDDWTLSNTQVGEQRMTLFASPDPHNPVNVSMTAQPLPRSDMDLAAYSEYYIKAVGPAMEAEKLQYELVSTGDVTLAGQPGKQMIFTLIGKSRARSISIWTVRDDRVYTFTGSASEVQFDAQRGVIDEIAKSVVIR